MPTLTNTLRSFIYTSLLLQLGTIVSAVFSFIMLSDLPSEARKRAIQDPGSLPAKAMYEDDQAVTLSSGNGDMILLRKFGLGRTWEFMRVYMIICFLLGCFCSFITIGLCVWSVEALRVAIAVSVILGLIVLPLFVGFLLLFLTNSIAVHL